MRWGTKARRRALTIAACGLALSGVVAGCGARRSGRAARNPRGSSTAAASGTTTATETSTTATNITTQPLPTPTGADVIGAASRQSLFQQRTFSTALANLTALLGPKASITNMAVYPGEIDLVLDQPDGNARRIRVDHTGAVTEGKPSPLSTGPTAIYLNQLDAGVTHLLAADVAASENVPLSHVEKLVMVTDLPGQNAGWEIFALPRRGNTAVTYVALLSGAGLRRGRG